MAVTACTPEILAKIRAAAAKTDLSEFECNRIWDALIERHLNKVEAAKAAEEAALAKDEAA